MDKKKILVISQHYYPEPFRLPDICEALAARGYEVTVVTGTPNYPMGEIYPGYEKGQQREEQRNGVSIHRCPLIPRKTGILFRFLNYYSFSYSSKRYIRKLSGEYDVVFVNQTSPVMMADAGVLYKKLHGVPLVLYCMDLWPESLCVGGIKKGSLIYNLYKKVSGKIYRAVDKLLITSKLFRQYLTEMHEVDTDKIYYLPQYAEAQFLDLPPKQQSEEFHLLFAGNIGAAQSIDTIVEAARILQGQKIQFHIVGDGIELENLKKQAENLKNITFYGRKSLEEMPMYYAIADAMLITLTADPVISMTLPGKVQTYMAAGKPIVGAIDGETALVLQEVQGGYCGPAGDAVALAENIKKLIASGDAEKIGKKNREYYQNQFAKEKFVAQLIAHLEQEV